MLNIVYSGVGKTEAEIENAIKSGVGCINLESRDELKMILAIAKQLGIVIACFSKGESQC